MSSRTRILGRSGSDGATLLEVMVALVLLALLIVPVPPSRPGGSPDPAAFLAREIGAATILP